MSTYEDYKEKIDEIIKEYFDNLNNIDKKYKNNKSPAKKNQIRQEKKKASQNFKKKIIEYVKNEKDYNYKYYTENIVNYNYIINENTQKTKNIITNQNLNYSVNKNTNTFKKYNLLHIFLVILFQHFIPVETIYLKKVYKKGDNKIIEIKSKFDQYKEQLKSIKKNINKIFKTNITISSINKYFNSNITIKSINNLDLKNKKKQLINKIKNKNNFISDENNEVIKYLIDSDIKIFILNTYISVLYNNFIYFIEYAREKENIQNKFKSNFDEFNNIIKDLQNKYTELFKDNNFNKNLLNDYKKSVQLYCNKIINFIKFISNNLSDLNKDIKWHFNRFYTTNIISNKKIISNK